MQSIIRGDHILEETDFEEGEDTPETQESSSTKSVSPLVTLPEHVDESIFVEFL